MQTGYDIYTILEGCGIAILSLCVFGALMLAVATRKARREYRNKGYLRAPSGTRWIRFLMFKEYDAFDDSGTRFFFGITHICLIGVFVALAAVVVLFGCDFLFKNMDNLPGESGLPRGLNR
jgi:hypothetical protein